LDEKDDSERNSDGKRDRPSFDCWNFLGKFFGSSQIYVQIVVTAYNYRRYTNKIKEELNI